MICTTLPKDRLASIRFLTADLDTFDNTELRSLRDICEDILTATDDMLYERLTADPDKPVVTDAIIAEWCCVDCNGLFEDYVARESKLHSAVSIFTEADADPEDNFYDQVDY